MSLYTILIERTSSDSYNSERSETELPITWKDLDRAKEALKRIRNLYAIETQIEHDRTGKIDADKGRAMVREATGLNEEDFRIQSSSCMLLPLDDGTEQQVGTFWRGWGEQLHCATIIKVEQADDDMRFCPEDLPYDFFDLKTEQ